MAIEHILVLMLENRSFNHMLTYSGIAGLAGNSPLKSNPGPNGSFVAMSSTAPDRARSDPGHEFEDVDWQIYRSPRGVSAGANATRPITLTGFVDRSGPSAMECASPARIPAFTHLAREFLVCDHWFSSLPGPTWPNRFFVHAGSSGGLANSPGDLTTIGSMTFSDLGFSFEHGTLFDALEREGRSWRVYHGDHFPQVCAIDTLPSVFVTSPGQFRSQSEFVADANSGDLPHYTFIEPDYSILSSFRLGNSQHPSGTLASGDALIASVTQALMNSPLWEESLLFILYDEHGGFYDQMEPPMAPPPADLPLNSGKAKNVPTPEYRFDTYGIRIPAVVVSPWVPAGKIVPDVLDHASVIRTVFDVFAMKGHLTERDRTAGSLKKYFLAAPRTVVPLELPQAPSVEATPDGLDGTVDTPRSSAMELPYDEGALAGFTRIAASVDHALNQYRTGMDASKLDSIAREGRDLTEPLNLPVTTDPQAQRNYIAKVAAKVSIHRLKELTPMAGSSSSAEFDER
ncbi:MAG: alkaline phosphatase family protein [Proteobacteria bacterium]|nr:alkaline phosphatase family protein [Pseudomonadota bacterium]